MYTQKYILFDYFKIHIIYLLSFSILFDYVCLNSMTKYYDHTILSYKLETTKHIICATLLVKYFCFDELAIFLEGLTN